MADSNISGWWQVGEAPSVKAWCEQNVADACEALSSSTTLSAFHPDPDQRDAPPTISMWSSLWDDYVGKDGPHGTPVSVILDKLVEVADLDPEYVLQWLDTVAAQVAEARVKVAKIAVGEA